MPFGSGFFIFLYFMIQPPYLKKNDRVVVVAPARKPERESVEAALQTLRSWGMEVTTGDHLWADEHQYLSATDDHRLHDLQAALDDEAVRAVICARGGYGTSRLIDRLSFDRFMKNPKWVVGFSDITALHLKLQSIGVQSIHGIMPVLFPKYDAADSIESLRETLFGEPPFIGFPASEYNVAGDTSGVIVGGNLSLLVDSLGTSSEIETSGRLLFIEEVDEYHYKLDRMLVQLKRAGKLEGIKGLVVGHMTSIKDPALPFGQAYQELVRYHTDSLGIPVAFNFPSGHENPNVSWICGGHASLHVAGDRSLLSFA